MANQYSRSKVGPEMEPSSGECQKDCPSLLIEYIIPIKSDEKEYPMNFQQKSI